MGLETHYVPVCVARCDVCGAPSRQYVDGFRCLKGIKKRGWTVEQPYQDEPEIIGKVLCPEHCSAMEVTP